MCLVCKHFCAALLCSTAYVSASHAITKSKSFDFAKIIAKIVSELSADPIICITYLYSSGCMLANYIQYLYVVGKSNNKEHAKKLHQTNGLFHSVHAKWATVSDRRKRLAAIGRVGIWKWLSMYEFVCVFAPKNLCNACCLQINAGVFGSKAHTATSLRYKLFLFICTCVFLSEITPMDPHGCREYRNWCKNKIAVQ